MKRGRCFLGRMACLAFAASALLALASPEAAALPAIEGRVDTLDTEVTTVKLERAGDVWHREIKTDIDSTFFQLHFSDVAAVAGADFFLRAKDSSGKTILEVPGATFAKNGEYWTPFLPGAYALLEIEKRGSAGPMQIAFKLADLAVEARGARILSIQDPNKPKDRRVAFYAQNAGLTAAARSVAKLRFQKNQLLLTCTGFLVAESLLLTNQHCFDSAEACASAIALFGYQEDEDRNLAPGEAFRCERVTASDAGLDFTLIKLSGAPGARWGVLPWDLRAPAQGTALYIVQHPGGEPKRIALDGCAVKTQSAVGAAPGKETDLGHTCDTENGSSGSPMLSLENRIVGLHHLGFSLNDPRWLKENRAVKAAAIHARIAPFIP